MVEAREALAHATGEGDPPAASAAAWRDGAPVFEDARGADPAGAAVTAASVFDVASVSKVLATTSAVAVLVARGAVRLDDPVARWLPAFGGRDAVTPRSLLAHASGLPAWRPFFAEVMEAPDTAAVFEPDGRPDDATWDRARRRVLDALFATPLETPGRRVYSDLGFVALGALVEAASGARLDDFCREVLWAPLGLDLGYVDLRRGTGWLEGRHVLPTGRTRPREPAPGQAHLYAVPAQPARLDAGRVDDDNAFAMGGVAGHAGVFATAGAVARFGGMLLEEREGANRLGCGEVLRRFLAIAPADGPPRGLGFDVPTGPRSGAGTRLGDGPLGAFGHLGFTGCSLWLDLDRRLSVALLTNRTLEGRHRVEGIRALRPVFHDALLDALAPR
ncbi:MAG TPA: serine hydrolase domain-containing protein [Sandaracinaceae bacterium LLY-WYZ-13_1]|nr:serine hydrolase domain-containing protein [Sandaracinaceae bacterium LLY-WYZ-13_1]